MNPLGKVPLRGAAPAALMLLPLAILASPPPSLAAGPTTAGPATAGPATAGPTPACHGQAATLVGSQDAPLDGTGGPDVIVSNGASEVLAGAGDDLICVTGVSDNSDGPLIKDGAGDDLVDTSELTGPLVRTRLGLGSDSYLGRPGRDTVYAEGQTGDEDDIRTRDGHDFVETVGEGEWYLRVALGPRRDQLWLDDTVTFDIDGGHGRDLLLADGLGGTRVDLNASTWTDVRQEAEVRGFERIAIRADGLVLAGSPQPEWLAGKGCGVRVFGRGGPDALYVESSGGASCAPRAHGGAGDDGLSGSSSRDLLYGGAGHDSAFGGAGHDLCRAEEEEACEE